jgi:hypothetical protein
VTVPTPAACAAVIALSGIGYSSRR